MRRLILLLAVAIALPGYAAKPVSHLVAPPPGATLPVTLLSTLDSRNLTAGRPVIARLSQRVPVTANSYLPPKVEIIGSIVDPRPSSFGILFTQLRWKGETVPVHVRLVAAASVNNLFQASMPVGGTDRGTSSPADWTTRQVGGDEIYRSAGYGKVYNQFSEPVGHADLNGVYQTPAAPGDVPHAMGPFSTTATGLHGFTNFSLVSLGGADKPVSLSTTGPKWKLPSGTALLLEAVR